MSNLKDLMPVYPDILADLAVKTLADGDLIMATAASTAGTGDPAWASVTNGLSARNLLINGEMKVAQRGTSFAAANGYNLDQWNMSQGTDGAVTVTQSTTVPNSTFVNSLKVDVTTADAAIGAAQEQGVIANIEGLRCSRISFGTADAKALTLSFWVRVDSAVLSFPATFSGSIRNSAGNRSYPFQYTVTASTTWQKIVVVIPGDVTGTWLQTNGIGLRLYLALAVGSSLQGAAATWASANYLGTASQANFMGDTGNDLYLTGVQLEVGTVDTPFEYLAYGNDLYACKRYYERMTSTVANENVYGASGYNAIGGATQQFVIQYEVLKRVAPTVAVSAVGDFDIIDSTAGTVACTDIVFALIGLLSCRAVTTATGTTVLPALLRFDSTTGRWISFSAEL